MEWVVRLLLDFGTAPSRDNMSTALETELENDIIFGVYAPGTRITEDSVMAQYDAKRHAVRNAFAQLESRGLLVGVVGALVGSDQRRLNVVQAALNHVRLNPALGHYGGRGAA